MGGHFGRGARYHRRLLCAHRARGGSHAGQEGAAPASPAGGLSIVGRLRHPRAIRFRHAIRHTRAGYFRHRHSIAFHPGPRGEFLDRSGGRAANIRRHRLCTAVRLPRDPRGRPRQDLLVPAKEKPARAREGGRDRRLPDIGGHGKVVRLPIGGSNALELGSDDPREPEVFTERLRNQRPPRGSVRILSQPRDFICSDLPDACAV